VLSQRDKDAIEALAESFEIDFLSVSYARDGEDIAETRAFLDGLGMQSTKVCMGQPKSGACTTGARAVSSIRWGWSQQSSTL
jgi:pyruvate kinase